MNRECNRGDISCRGVLSLHGGFVMESRSKTIIKPIWLQCLCTWHGWMAVETGDRDMLVGR